MRSIESDGVCLFVCVSAWRRRWEYQFCIAPAAGNQLIGWFWIVVRYAWHANWQRPFLYSSFCNKNKSRTTYSCIYSYNYRYILLLKEHKPESHIHCHYMQKMIVNTEIDWPRDWQTFSTNKCFECAYRSRTLANTVRFIGQFDLWCQRTAAIALAHTLWLARNFVILLAINFIR